MTDPDEPLQAPRVSCFPDERSFQEQLRVGDYVRAGRDKHYELNGVRYITKGVAYRVIYCANNDGHYFFRTTTDLPLEATYLCWADLDNTPHDG